MFTFQNFCLKTIGLLLFIAITVSCRKDEVVIAHETGTITDIDGNVYKTVKIGEQWWMAENLKVSRYRNGDSIVYVKEQNFQLDTVYWKNTMQGAYCIIDNNSISSQNYQGKKFGFLYNWHSIADTRQIAPAGWHVPTDDDWKQLERYLGLSDTELNNINWRGTDEGDALKSQNGWAESYDKFTIWGNNKSGFSALGGGCCMFNGSWGSPGLFKNGFWWTSTTSDENSWYRYLDYNSSGIFRFYGSKQYGFSIRCVKD